jgi:hypothetical protein
VKHGEIAGVVAETQLSRIQSQKIGSEGASFDGSFSPFKSNGSFYVSKVTRRFN